jgi:alanine-glyoxylate transaminase/serine-glyoxylate transaminase/serine-pyruvate transaminase
VISPLTELAQIAHEVQPDALLIVDASSSLGGIAFSSDELGLDVVFAESCQCLALPPWADPGFSSARAFERAAANPQRGTALT